MSGAVFDLRSHILLAFGSIVSYLKGRNRTVSGSAMAGPARHVNRQTRFRTHAMPLGLILLLALIGLPLIEIAVFVEVGSEIGAVPTILLTVLTALAGTVMLRMQGLSLLTRMRAEMDRGEVPGEDIVQGALIVVASFLLLVPGFVTDAVGIALFIPPLRAVIARAVVRNARVTVVRPGGPGARRGDGVVDLDPDAWSDVAPGERGGNGETPWRGGRRLTDGRDPRAPSDEPPR